jgi:hypothetical protein
LFELVLKQIGIGTLGIIVALDIFLAFLLFWKFSLKYFKEMRLVGFRNWVWFVVFLKRDEFHPSLGYAVTLGKERLTVHEFKQRTIQLVKKRNLAHQLDQALENNHYTN